MTRPRVTRRPSSAWVAAASLLAVWCGVAYPAAHTFDAPSNFQELVAEATLVVRGRVTGTRGARLPDREFSTALTVTVEAVLKGEPVRTVSVLVPGGVEGRIRTVMVGVPTFAIGDRAVWFLRRGPDGLWRPVGLAAGVFRIRARQTGVAVVRAPVVAGVTAEPGPIRRGDGARQPMALGEFEALIELVGRAPIRRTAPVAPTRRTR